MWDYHLKVSEFGDDIIINDYNVWNIVIAMFLKFYLMFMVLVGKAEHNERYIFPMREGDVDFLIKC